MFNETMSFLDSVVEKSRNALNMMFSYDNFGNDTKLWALLIVGSNVSKKGGANSSTWQHAWVGGVIVFNGCCMFFFWLLHVGLHWLPWLLNGGLPHGYKLAANGFI
ncbi:hypothetical protein L3X38_036675 [Prunus dulcis]|uniref:Transmembrane protein n=1 Tax=Prunus dulcis TaxID=3755 RepID=A0AAD4V271_PRUDU|nr:hypothetical protein L3X38_036675 [Prunus dulcis]